MDDIWPSWFSQLPIHHILHFFCAAVSSLSVRRLWETPAKAFLISRYKLLLLFPPASVLQSLSCPSNTDEMAAGWLAITPSLARLTSLQLSRSSFLPFLKTSVMSAFSKTPRTSLMSLAFPRCLREVSQWHNTACPGVTYDGSDSTCVASETKFIFQGLLYASLPGR